jgi:hypothetical protein
LPLWQFIRATGIPISPFFILIHFIILTFFCQANHWHIDKVGPKIGQKSKQV